MIKLYTYAPSMLFSVGLAFSASPINPNATVNPLNNRLFPIIVNGPLQDGAAPLHTTFTLVNLDSVPISFTIVFFDYYGVISALPIDGVGMTDTFVGTIAAKGVATIRTDGSGPLAVRYGFMLTNSADGTPGTAPLNIAGHYTITQEGPPANIVQSQIPIGEIGESHFVLRFDATGSRHTEFYFINLSSKPVSYPCTVRDQAGSQLQTGQVFANPFGVGGFSTDDYKAVLGGKQGTIECSGSSSGAVGLLFESSAASFTVLTPSSLKGWN